MNYKKVTEQLKKATEPESKPQPKPNCMDCPSHKVIADPDPHDWFNDDDQAVLCTLTNGNPDHNPESRYHSDKQNMHRCITRSCRPYQKRAECETPDWCPKLPQPKTKLHEITI